MMDEEKSCALIIGSSDRGLQMSSAGGRISTTEGTALSVFNKSQESDEVNSKLVKKVLNSGHKTIIEHHCFNVAFNNVSVIVEQFLIEFRLTSFTIKSRRYVNFSNAGYYLPEIDNQLDKIKFENATKNLFSAYSNLIEKGLIKEDARFLLPYNFKSNILLTCNARELTHIVCTMIYGRGKVFKELVELGNQLKTQLENFYPNLVENEKLKYEAYDKVKIKQKKVNLKEITYVNKSKVELLTCTQNVEKAIMQSLKLQGINKYDLLKLIKDGKTSRVLEQINFTFKIKDITLASLTHLTRHRMQSLIVPNLQNIINNNRYKIAPKILENEEYLQIFKNNILETNKVINELSYLGAETLAYLFVSARTIDVITTINARELLWFFKLRTCDRAQWEIRDIAKTMLKLVKKAYPKIFEKFGPSCLVDGRCPEGRLTCGKIKTAKDFK